ncbi:DUF305 domain-containing protein [Nonomuraea zeae]|uniref:DUF305 domain-containing protein n=1 Tax=Nonomuraea zeae TaxID=1642303 RepID=UPI001478A447|nr:DUF305 domain-containing protein [Nonomuraea zeae]
MTFSKDMITHHEQTIQLAEVGADRGTTSYVRELSKKLIAEEQADITMMSSWLQSWQEPVPVPPAETMGADLPKGPDFDRQWLKALAGHLEHGVHMAEAVSKAGKHGPTLELAGKIRSGQQAELAEIAKHMG